MRPFLVLVAVVFAASSFGASSRETYLSCSLTGPENTRNEYSFALDSDKSTLFWVEGSQTLKITRNTSTQLWASQEVKPLDATRDSTDFRLKRVTGAAELNRLLRLSSDAASCRKEQNRGCEEFIVVPEKSEVGTCRSVGRAVG